MADAAQDLSALIGELRPRLHRYCARMTGSAIEGEDVVQDALAKAAEAWPGAEAVERPDRWLFRIAHNCALDALRRRRRLAARAGESGGDPADPSASADARVAAAASLGSFMALTPAERSSVLLGDVLGYSLAETGEILGASLASVKAALHRGRTRLKAVAAADAPTPRLDPAERARLKAYADRFNARDFDALRDLLAEDVRLDLVNRVRMAGRKEVSVYFTRYSQAAVWSLAPVLAEGRPALLATDPAGAAPSFVILIDWAGERIAAIRDFHYAAYVMEGLEIASL